MNISYLMYLIYRYQIKYKKNTKVLEKIKTVYSDYCSWYINSKHSDSQNTRQQWQKIVHKHKSIGADIVSIVFLLYTFLELNIFKFFFVIPTYVYNMLNMFLNIPTLNQSNF